MNEQCTLLQIQVYSNISFILLCSCKDLIILILCASFLVPSCPIKGQFYTTDCYIANATCNDPNPVAKCNYPRCVCPRGQVIDEATNSCINGTQCRKYKITLRNFIQ